MIPRYIQAVLEKYRDTGTPTGGFLQAVLENDLFESFGGADEQNRIALFDIVKWCWNELPAAAWGSRKVYNEWLAKGGLDGLREKGEVT